MKSLVIVFSVFALVLQCGLILFGLHTATAFSWQAAAMASCIIFVCSLLFEVQKGYAASRNVLGAVLCYFSFEFGILIWVGTFLAVPIVLGKLFKHLSVGELK